MRYLSLPCALWALAGVALAQALPPQTATSATVEAPARVTAPPPLERAWRLGLALGYGERTNPLIQSEDIPIVVDIDIAWFGKRWFFDNGDLGFALVDHARFTTNLVARVNSDRAFFGKTNTRFVTFAPTGSAGGAQPPDFLAGDPPPPVEVKPPDRDYAIELGFEVLTDGEWGQASLRAFHDVGGTHEGYEIAADYGYRWIRGRLSVAPSVGIAYKDAAYNDYYWGVHADEASRVLREYHVDGGFGWEAGLRTSYYLTKSIRLSASANYERLQDSVAASPLVEDTYVFGYFAGLAWTF